MRFTNNAGLPEAFVRAAARFSGYRPRPGVIRVSELRDAPQRRVLAMRHWDSLSEDVSDRVWAIFGQLCHAVMEKHAGGGEIAEQKITVEFEGWTISGTADHYDVETGVITDWKTTSTWRLARGLPREWEEQLNCYAFLMRRAGRDVKGLQIVSIYRDHSMSEANQAESYPRHPVETHRIRMWPDGVVEEYIRRRLELHARAERGEEIPCTDDERWMRPASWIVMKKGGKRAERVFKSEDEAREFVASGGRSDRIISMRKAEAMRCNYCNVRMHCPQFEAENEVEGL